ncbi:MAG: phosphate acetyltransferase [Acidiferrobacteraceae bacterium]|nr:phosphate acetyltransferase [Acidiferrobacteraceae bacterium]|tara:strand:+ start:272 stop:1285 length:1014 start_codon:yes stop_codon:yes gene_type:complete
MRLPEKILQKAKDASVRIVLPEGEDIRIIEAANLAVKENLAEIILLGNKEKILEIASQKNMSLTNLEIVDPNGVRSVRDYANLLISRKTKGTLSMEKATKQALQPLVFANCMVANGDADGCVAGATTSTAEIIRHAIRIVGQHPSCPVISSFFLMLFDSTGLGINYPVLFADCGLVIDPNSEELAAIAASTADNAELLLNTRPVIAMLSFSTLGSARHPMVKKVREAKKLLAEEHPKLKVHGEIQFDAAIHEEIFSIKGGRKEDYTKPNVFIFPNLDSGNIAYKLAERTAGAIAIGPILQGINKPINDLSRGCTAQDIVQNIVITACQASSLREKDI